jgi:hypothetical protein
VVERANEISGAVWKWRSGKRIGPVHREARNFRKKKLATYAIDAIGPVTGPQREKRRVHTWLRCLAHDDDDDGWWRGGGEEAKKKVFTVIGARRVRVSARGSPIHFRTQAARVARYTWELCRLRLLLARACYPITLIRRDIFRCPAAFLAHPYDSDASRARELET